MNINKQHWRIQNLGLKMKKLKGQLRTAISRLDAAKTRYNEVLSIYRECEAKYAEKEERIHQNLNSKKTGFRINFATTLVSLCEQRKLKMQHELEKANLVVTKSRSELQQARCVLETATKVLTETFAKKHANVPHIVEVATMPISSLVLANEYECRETQTQAENAMKRMRMEEKSVEIYRQDLVESLQARNAALELKLQKYRKNSDHEKMLEAASEAMNSAKAEKLKIQRRIRALECEIRGL